MPTTRRLTDLYKVGKEVLINDDSGGDPVKIYLRKLNPIEQETAVKRANSARAKVAVDGKQPGTDIYNDLHAQVEDLGGREIWIEMVISDELGKFQQSVESELENEEEWANDGYLQGLYDAWEDSLRETYEADNEDPEAARVFSEMTRFQEEVTGRVAEKREDLIEAHGRSTDEELIAKTIERLTNFQGNTEWLREYRKSQVWLAVRETDEKTRYFSEREEVDELPLEVYNRILDEYSSLEVPASEGKDLQQTDSSSPQSEQDEVVEAE